MSISAQFFIDRGGTFTDIVLILNKREWHCFKYLSTSPFYSNSIIYGISDVIEKFNISTIEEIRIGTTIATNALLEKNKHLLNRKFPRIICLCTKGFKDTLQIGHQTRPDIFNLNINRGGHYYHDVIEINERIDYSGNVLIPLRPEENDIKFSNVYVICFLHSVVNNTHEIEMRNYLLEKYTGENINIILSSNISPECSRFFPRMSTSVIEGFLSPIVDPYINEILNYFNSCKSLSLMTSSGRLSSKPNAVDMVLSGPAGGVIGGAVYSLLQEEVKFTHVVTFDMGGTSTDVSVVKLKDSKFYVDQTQFLEPVKSIDFNAIIATPNAVYIHTVAAGGGSICAIDDEKFVVGPHSAGSTPGPACYGFNGYLTVTDLNLLLGRITADLFPKTFGPDAKSPLNSELSLNSIKEILCENEGNIDSNDNNLLNAAEGFLKIAIEKMANAIKTICIDQGLYSFSSSNRDTIGLVAYGGASGQVICDVADTLGFDYILFPGYAPVLSALGVGLADEVVSCETIYLNSNIYNIEYDKYIKTDNTQYTWYIRLSSSEHLIPIELSPKENFIDKLKNIFISEYLGQFGFYPSTDDIIVSYVCIEEIAINYNRQLYEGGNTTTSINENDNTDKECIEYISIYRDGKWNRNIQRIHVNNLRGKVNGPLVIWSDLSSIYIPDESWEIEITNRIKGDLLLKKNHNNLQEYTEPIPNHVGIEIFNDSFYNIATNMGHQLQRTSLSTNIKERHDFSCAIFDESGRLLANAPHMPVHIGSMGEVVKYLLPELNSHPNNVYLHNFPFKGGTHLPDLTVVSSVHLGDGVYYYLASRGHHADIGGKSPGSMPSNSCHIDEEGALFDRVILCENQKFNEDEIVKILTRFNARNIPQNIADLKAQVAAISKGQKELISLVNRYGISTVLHFTKLVYENSRLVIQNMIKKTFIINREYTSVNNNMDCGLCLDVILCRIPSDNSFDKLRVSFKNCSQMDTKSNFNAPFSIVRSVVLYCLRCLVKTPYFLPLNDGCLEDVIFDTVFDPPSFITPIYPAAVVAGNVETSSFLTNCVFRAISETDVVKIADCPGTMINFSFGNDDIQYYETICGGSGAISFFNNGVHGTSGVHTHMTNSRITDVEIFESRYGDFIRILSFGIRDASGGIGDFYNGGNGVYRRFIFLKEMTVNVLANSMICPPRNICGKKEPLGTIFIRNNKEYFNHIDHVECVCDDVFEIYTPGGGGI